MKQVQKEAGQFIVDFEPASRKKLESMFFNRLKRLAVFVRQAEAQKKSDGTLEAHPEILARVDARIRETRIRQRPFTRRNTVIKTLMSYMRSLTVVNSSGNIEEQ